MGSRSAVGQLEEPRVEQRCTWGYGVGLTGEHGGLATSEIKRRRLNGGRGGVMPRNGGGPDRQGSWNSGGTG
jgi:hypothetical protein